MVTIISPALIPELFDLTKEHSITVIQRPYRAGDLEGAFLVIAATDDPDLNRSIWKEANRCRCLINVVDDPHHSNFILPAVVRRGDFTLAVSTGGGSPALSRRVREQLEVQYGPEYGELARLLEELRPVLLSRFETQAARLAAVLSILDGDLMAVLREDGYEAARQAVLEKWADLSGK
jgi:precorrin-2 dehydrogenase/sirohydrochlorin ferrochelatase